MKTLRSTNWEWALKIFGGLMLFIFIAQPLQFAYVQIVTTLDGIPITVLDWRQTANEVHHLLEAFIVIRVLLCTNPNKGRLKEYWCWLWVLFYITVSRTFDLGFDPLTRPSSESGEYRWFIMLRYTLYELAPNYLFLILMTLHYRSWLQQNPSEYPNWQVKLGQTKAKTKAEAEERTPIVEIKVLTGEN